MMPPGTRCDLVGNPGVNGRMLLTLQVTDGVWLAWPIAREV